jgi:DNA invertase Pin-like site-specific DNA recombinase
MNNCIGYIRVSTERQAGEAYTSLGDQQAAIEKLAAKLGVSVGRWYRDEGASGATAERRPAFSAMLADCEANQQPQQSGFILALNDSRWGRFADPEESAYWRHHMRRLGYIVRFAEGDESEDKTARSVMRAIGAAQATEYRDNIRRNAKRGARGTAELGYWTREAPYGYRRAVAYPPGRERVLDLGMLKAPDEKVRLTPHPEESAIVAWAFAQYATGMLSAIRLVPELKRRAPRLRWSARHVQALLSNPVYCGDIVGGRHPSVEDGGSQVFPRPQSEWYGKRDAHPPIVPRELWLEVQRRLSLNSNRGKAVHAAYLLSGLMTCPYCGQRYIGGGGGRNRKFYKCSGAAEGLCPGRTGTIMRHLIDDSVVVVLARAFRDPRVLAAIERALDEALTSEPEQAAESESSLRVARSKVKTKRDRLVRLLADGLLEPVEAAPQLEILRAELAELDTHIEVLRFRGRSVTPDVDQRARLLAMAQRFEKLAAQATPTELRALVEPWLEGAEFDKVLRRLTLRIRPIPVLGGFLPVTRPVLSSKLKVMVWHVDLIQRTPGARIQIGQPVRRAAV